MRKIRNLRSGGLPNGVRIVFVKANLQGEQSCLSCIEYVFTDPRIQALGCAWEQCKEILANVGFAPDGKAKPYHTVSTLTHSYFIKISL